MSIKQRSAPDRSEGPDRDGRLRGRPVAGHTTPGVSRYYGRDAGGSVPLLRGRELRGSGRCRW